MFSGGDSSFKKLHTINRRMFIISAAKFLIFGGIIARLFSLQIKKSKIYTTKPMYNYNQKYFLNMVIEISTILDPEFLLSELKNIELKKLLS